MLRKIEKPKVRKRFWEAMKAKDAQVCYKEYDRVVKLPCGTTKIVQYNMKPHELERTKIERVFNTILNWYTDHYNRMAAVMPAGTYDDGSYPKYKTTNPEIGHSAGCSDRTVRSMIAILMDMGVLKKESKGSRGGILVQFSEGILWGETAEEKAQIMPCDVVPESSIVKYFPHNNIYINNSEKGNINKDEYVDKDRTKNRERGEQIADFGQNSTQMKLTGYGMIESKGGGGGSENVENPVESMKRHTKAEKDAYRKARASENEKIRLQAQERESEQYVVWTNACKQAVMHFWAVSYEKLYAGRNYDNEDVKIILNTIWSDVFHSFKTIRNTKELAIFLARQLAKIEKVATYYDRKPDAYLPDPHSIMVQGKGYFDAKNYRGFAGTEAWMKKDETTKGYKRLDFLNPKEFKARKINRLLSTARKDFEKQRAGAKARVEVAHLDMVGLMQYYTLIFSSLGQDALQRYNAQILQQQRSDFKSVRKTHPPVVIEVEAWMNSFGA